MSITQLSVLGAVVEMRSFTKAAEALHTSQSAASHAVAALERELAVSTASMYPKLDHITPSSYKRRVSSCSAPDLDHRRRRFYHHHRRSVPEHIPKESIGYDRGRCLRVVFRGTEA